MCCLLNSFITELIMFPVLNLQSFSSTQISWFTPAQANAITSEQQEYMSTEQKTALQDAGASNVSISSAQRRWNTIDLFEYLCIIY